ncbi:LamG-like jellyroll fold domain-containing protein [Aestuariivivens sp. NBU2969]|uniref:LamG-like jellyroll fold domain-containing protein n=1 Tax=Aestuariivivens sp. NBU2969 TaxID=2873267 RepID=UPI001CBE88D4|nr:LamG-like jellyroll fold domain-containing protein [Aestuariivivens sp. NBU2969]
MKLKITFLLIFLGMNLVVNAQTDPLAGKAYHGTKGQWTDARATGFTVPNTAEMTITAWIKPVGDQDEWAAIASFNCSTAPTGTLALNLKAVTGETHNRQLGFHWPGTAHYGYDTGLIVPDNEWSFVAISGNATKITIVLNDQVWEVNDPAPSAITTENTTLWIGSYNNYSNRIFNGYIDEVTVYSRALSIDELRLARHLIKSQTDLDNDASIISYYQFNSFMDDTTNYIHDFKSGYDARIAGATLPTLDPSMAPIGTGASEKMTINGAGTYNFSTAKASMTFIDAGPGGDVVVTKLDNAPSNLPATNAIDDTYWIINNYGTNSSFTAISDITFSGINNIDGTTVPNTELFKRSSSSDAQGDWGASIATASSINTTNKSASFSGITSFSQFYVGSSAALGIYDLQKSNFKVYPNPVEKGNVLRIKDLNETAAFSLFDVAGKKVYNLKIETGNKIDIPTLSRGVYFYRLETASKIGVGKLLVK